MKRKGFREKSPEPLLSVVGDTGFVEKDFIFNHDFVKDKIVNPNLGVIWSKFYKTSLIKENKIRFSTYKIYNDVVFHFKSMLKAERISYYSETFYHYTKTNQASLQNSFRWGKYESLWFYVMLEIRDFLEENNLIEDFKDEFVNYSMKSFKNNFPAAGRPATVTGGGTRRAR